jgi:citrate synthase
VPRKTAWIDAKAATKLLDVSRATLYAYVSRGYVRSEPVPGARASGGMRERTSIGLRVRAEERRNPEKAAAHALRWGVPILESAITLIADGKLYYRGQDAGELARNRSLEEVASLIWCGSFDADLFDTPLHVVSGLAVDPDLPFINRAQSVLPLVAARDSLAFDLRPRNVAQTGWRIVNLLTSVAAASQELEATVEETLAREWAPSKKDAPKLIRAALIVCADHELNVSAFTARCVASASSNPYAVVIAGLAALEGTKHGGATARVDALSRELRRARDVRGALAERLRRGEPHRRLRPSALSRRRSARGVAVRNAPEVEGAHLRPHARRKCRQRPRRKAESRLCPRRRRTRPRSPARLRAGAVRYRPHHRLDRARERAVRAGLDDPSAGEVCGAEARVSRRSAVGGRQ